MLFSWVGVSWRSGKYAGQSYEAIGPSFKLFGHGERPEIHTT